MEIAIFVSMKWLCIILALLILGLSVQPVCAEEPGAASCCASDCAGDNDNKNHHRERPCEGGCNPFQQCSCCLMAMVLPYSTLVETSVMFSSKMVHESMLYVAYTKEIHSSFWQPPRYHTA